MEALVPRKRSACSRNWASTSSPEARPAVEVLRAQMNMLEPAAASGG
jgi:hypothetical protein